MVASTIWSGTGEVNTSPAQAASSMPEPDEPAVHRLVAGAAAGDQADLARPGRVAAVDDPVLVVDPHRSRCAASMPRSASATTSAGSLMSFFIGAPLPSVSIGRQ